MISQSINQSINQWQIWNRPVTKISNRQVYAILYKNGGWKLRSQEVLLGSVILLFSMSTASYNTCHISWDRSGIFCPINVGVCEWDVRSKKINTGMEGAHIFVEIWVQHGVSQLNVPRIVGLMLIVAGKITEPWALSDSPVDTTYKEVITVQ